MKLVEQRVQIDAPPSRVYELLTDAQLLVQWLAPIVTAEPTVGGKLAWTHANGDEARGEYVELVPDRRVVFTFGWDRADVEVPPGSSVVEIDLRPRNGGTQLDLVHRGLPGPMVDPHTGGWANYLTRLAAVAEHRDPGPDPLAHEHVPTAAEARRRPHDVPDSPSEPHAE